MLIGAEQTNAPSPCVNVCRIDEGSGLCAGCLRTRAEIAAWRDAPADAQRAILATCERRRAGQALSGGLR